MDPTINLWILLVILTLYSVTYLAYCVVKVGDGFVTQEWTRPHHEIPYMNHFPKESFYVIPHRDDDG